MPAARPRPALVLLHLAALGAAALVFASLASLAVGAIASSLRLSFPVSLVFSSSLLAAAWAVRFTFPADRRDRATAFAAAAGVGALPFLAFCADEALTVPTWDARPLEGVGILVLAVIAIALLAAGPLASFVLSIPLVFWSNHETRAFLRFLAALGALAAFALAVPAAVRRGRFPDPDGYLPSLPSLARTIDGTCPVARCIRCPPGNEPRPFVLVDAEGERALGSVEAPCEALVFRHDTARRWVLVSGDVDKGRDRVAWAPTGVYEERGSGLRDRRLEELRDRLAPPLAWIVEALLGVAFAAAALWCGRRAPGASPEEADGRATAFAALAFAAALLLATPLATAWYRGLVVPLP
jgi:hypothetical protein